MDATSRAPEHRGPISTLAIITGATSSIGGARARRGGRPPAGEQTAGRIGQAVVTKLAMRTPVAVPALWMATSGPKTLTGQGETPEQSARRTRHV